MITVSQKVGRLAEVRMTAPVTPDDMTAMQRDMSGLLTRAQGRIVICADLSHATVFGDDLADRMTRFLRADNLRIERAAILVGDGATFFLQVERLLREVAAPSSSPSRPDSSRDQSMPPRRPTEPQPSKRPPTDPTLGKRATSDPHLARRSSERRAFRSPAEAMTWLDEVLTSDERARLRMFLEGPRPST